MIRDAGRIAEVDSLTDEQLRLQNYQRRSPLPAVVIKRVSQLDTAAIPENGMVQMEVGQGRIELVSGLATYSTNAIRLAAEGEQALQAALAAEMDIAK